MTSVPVLIEQRRCPRSEWRAWHRYQRSLRRADQFDPPLSSYARAGAYLRFNDEIAVIRITRAFTALAGRFAARFAS